MLLVSTGVFLPRTCNVRDQSLWMLCNGFKRMNINKSDWNKLFCWIRFLLCGNILYIFMGFFSMYFCTSRQHSRRVQKLVDEPHGSTWDKARKHSATLMKARLNVIFVFPCVVSVSQLIKAALTWKVARPWDIQLLCFTPDSYLLYSRRLTWTEDEGAGRLLSRQNKQRNRNIWWHSGSHVQPVSLSVESKWLGFCFLLIGLPFKVIILGLLT